VWQSRRIVITDIEDTLTRFLLAQHKAGCGRTSQEM